MLGSTQVIFSKGLTLSKVGTLLIIVGFQSLSRVDLLALIRDDLAMGAC